jgi:hypothetical protein
MEREQLLQAIDDYAAASGLSPKTVCQYAVKGSNLYDRLRAGGECLPRTARKIMSYIASNPPGAA